MLSTLLQPANPVAQPTIIYAWHAPTILLPAITSAMSKELGLHHNLVRDALGHEVHRVIGDVNSYTKVYPPISEEHQFKAKVANKQWLKGSGLHQRFSDFIEALRDDLDLLRRHCPYAMGLYTTPEHIRKCCENDTFYFPIITERDVQDVQPWMGEKDMALDMMVRQGRVLSQGAAMILPEFAEDYLLPQWVDNEQVYVHQMPQSLLAYSRRMFY